MFHVIFTLAGRVYSDFIRAKTISEVESWLEGIGASYWEIGILEDGH